MDIYVCGVNNKDKKIGNTDSHPIPRIGERIDCGYSPAPTVTMILYQYEENRVVVGIDGFIIE